MVLHRAIPLAPCPWLLHHKNPNTPTSPPSAPRPSCRRRVCFDIRSRGECSAVCRARRRVRYEDDDEDDDEEFGHNMQIAMLEGYSETARDEALLVQAAVDGDVEVVLIFRGFSSCLSSRTASDPSRSILPERAVITSIDVVKGPFDPNNIEYLDKGLTWEAFKGRLQ